MASFAGIAQQILTSSPRGKPSPLELSLELIESALDPRPERAREASRALFSILAEGLADRFELSLCESYAEIFSHAIARARPEWRAEDLLSRYHRVRQPRPVRADPSHVFVLSRVTLGADIAITSLVLDAAKRRFPKANLFLVGGEKSWKLFAADPRIEHVPASYDRYGTLAERLAVGLGLRDTLAQPNSLILDPDSRLTQLGLLPVCPEESYFFFESRSYGAESNESLSSLTRRWLAETLEIADAAPYIAPAEQPDLGEGPFVTMSLGVGENPAKRLPDPFEEELIRTLAARRTTLVIDKGAGNEEADRVERAIARSGVSRSQVRTFQGSFAAFASMIAKSRLYVGYDSAGQHAAAASGTPLVTVFAGFASPRMFARWRPTGAGPIEVVRVDDPNPVAGLERTLHAIDGMLNRRLG